MILKVIQWIFVHGKQIVWSMIVGVVGFIFHFIVMGYNTEARIERAESGLVELRRENLELNKQQSKMLGLMEAMNENVKDIKVMMQAQKEHK